MNKADLLIADKLLAHQIDLFRFTAGERKRVLGVLTDMQDELVDKLKTGLTDFGKARANKLLKEATATISDYYKDLGTQLDLLDLVAHEADIVGQSFASIGLEASLPAETVFKSIVSNVLIEGAPSSAWWQKQGDDLNFQFSSAVRQGIAQGETLQQMIVRIAGSKKLGVPGVFEVSRRNASALVHTSIQTVANDSRLATFRENSDIIKGVRQLSTLDGHTSFICVARSGASWDLEGKPINGTEFPFQSPPLHFNCRSVLVPITKTYKELGIDVPEKGVGTRSSDLGQIKADTTFDAFLKRHDAEYVDKLLGPGRAQLWREGKLTLKDLVSGEGRTLTLRELRGISGRTGDMSSSIHQNAIDYVQNIGKTKKVEAAFIYDSKGKELLKKDGAAHYIEFTPDEFAKMKGGTLVHNHPGGFSFSKVDFDTSAYAELNTIVAVTKEGTQFVGKSSKWIPQDVYEKITKEVDAVIRGSFSAKMITVDDANMMFHHATNEALLAKGEIQRYSVDTPGKVFSEFMNRNSSLLEEIVNSVIEKVK